jgi:hypothetical protein
MKERLRACVVIAIGLSALLTNPPALASDDTAATPAAPLTGETLIASELGDPGTSIVTGTCNPAGTSTFEFSVSGVAVGPYSGTFTEQGTLTLGPALAGFQPLAFESTFTITSEAGTVTGTKSLPDTVGAGVGACGEAVSEAGHADAIVFQANVGYTATITTAAGSSDDCGVTNVDYSDHRVRGVTDFNAFNFVESFVSSGRCDDDDGDDDGDDDDGDDDDGDDG